MKKQYQLHHQKLIAVHSSPQGLIQFTIDDREYNCQIQSALQKTPELVQLRSKNNTKEFHYHPPANKREDHLIVIKPLKNPSCISMYNRGA